MRSTPWLKGIYKMKSDIECLVLISMLPSLFRDIIVLFWTLDTQNVHVVTTLKMMFISFINNSSTEPINGLYGLLLTPYGP